MRLSFLSHILAAVSALARPERIIVLGSSSLLPGHPELGEPGQPLEPSADADLLLQPIDEALASMLREAVGEDSLFAQRNGYYAHLLRPEIAETLPSGWDSRIRAVAGQPKVFALDPYDLALVKLVVSRAKDLDLVRALLRLGIVKPEQLRSHYQQSSLGERDAVIAGRNLGLLLAES